MKIRYDRIEAAQQLMRSQGLMGVMVMNADDFRFFFGELRVQPRAIIPQVGPPIVIGFKGEEPELQLAIADGRIKTFGHVGEQIANVRKTFIELFTGPPAGIVHPSEGPPRIGMQMWFDTPAFLVDLFRRANPQFELVSSDPVMDELRMVKEPAELDLMREAQRIAALGMDRARELLRPGMSGHALATEVLYTMMKAGACGTSTPIHINSGVRSCWVHGAVNTAPIAAGDLVVIDLTPQREGYCANLARTFVLGTPAPWQAELLETYRTLHERTRVAMVPGTTGRELDRLGKALCAERGFAEHHLNGICHGIGLRFEEIPASTIIPTHRAAPLREGMTVTVGHTVLALPGRGGVRFEDVCRVTPAGGEVLHPYPIDWQVPL